MSAEISLYNDEVPHFFTGDMSLISSSIASIRIYDSEGVVVIDLQVTLLYAKEHRDFTIRFGDVDEYSFYHHRDYNFYNIERFKFFKNGSAFYISLDPDETTPLKSENDNDFITSKVLQAFSI